MPHSTDMCDACESSNPDFVAEHIADYEVHPIISKQITLTWRFHLALPNDITCPFALFAFHHGSLRNALKATPAGSHTRAGMPLVFAGLRPAEAVGWLASWQASTGCISKQAAALDTRII